MKNNTFLMKGTKKSYQATLNTLRKYSSTLKKELDFNDIDLGFYDNFIKFLTYSIKHTRNSRSKKKEHIKVGYKENTIGNRIKNLKVFMNYANEKGYTTNSNHNNRKFRKVEETAETIYLNDNDLSILYNLDLKKNPKLARVRDLFLIGCYTGLPFSDLTQLTPEKFIKNGTQLKIKTIKTGETVVIPLHWTIREILNKYDGEIPRIISNQKMNEYIKELGKKADISTT